uniref:Electron transfer flavoprotein subunit alpha n=1 Tax=Syphacia muris TaxID=451379 RepID=A0A158R538_9BILA
MLAAKLPTALAGKLSSRCCRLVSTLVLAEHDEVSLNPITLNAVSAASKLGDITVLVGGKNVKKIAEEAAKVENVKKVLVAQDKKLEGQLPEYMTNVVMAAQDQYKFDSIVASASSFSRGLIPRVAAKYNSSPISDIISIIDGNTFIRPIYAGNALCKVRTKAPLKLLTVRTTAFPPANLKGGNATIGDVTNYRFPEYAPEFVKQEIVKSERPDLLSAKVVVSGGRGLGSTEKFKLIYNLADKLNAAVGASRAAVDAGYVPNDLQVGQTGKIVSPQLYIAVGISGAIQHLAGMKDSKVIVAINKDPEAPIFQVADYGLRADLFKALPELIQAL